MSGEELRLSPIIRGEVVNVETESGSRAAKPLAIGLVLVIAIVVVAMQLVALPGFGAEKKLRTHLTTAPAVGQVLGRWQLFAPAPPSTSRDVEVKYVCEYGDAESPTWRNLSAGLRHEEKPKAILQSRLSLIITGEVNSTVAFAKAGSTSLDSAIESGTVLLRTLLLVEADYCNGAEPFMTTYRIVSTDVSYAHRNDNPAPVVVCQAGTVRSDIVRQGFGELLPPTPTSRQLACVGSAATQPVENSN